MKELVGRVRLPMLRAVAIQDEHNLLAYHGMSRKPGVVDSVQGQFHERAVGAAPSLPNHAAN